MEKGRRKKEYGNSNKEEGGEVARRVDHGRGRSEVGSFLELRKSWEEKHPSI